MVLDPKNSWIEVELSFEEDKAPESLIALPEDYKPAEKPYKAVTIVKDPEMGKKGYKVGDVVIVPTHVIREIEIRDNKFYLIERNHVMAKVLV